MELQITNYQIYELLKETKAINTKATEELKQEVRSIRKEILEELKCVKEENLALREENKKLKERLINTERKTKKYNLVLYGIKDEEDENNDIGNFLNILDIHLNIKASITDLRDFYRIGKVNENITRPVLVELLNYKLKTDILANVKKFKGTGIFVAEDYTPEDYTRQKILRTYLKQARENGQQAFIKSNILVIQGEKYTVEDLEDQKHLVTKVNIEAGGSESAQNGKRKEIVTKKQIRMDEKTIVGGKEKERKITTRSRINSQN